MKNTQKKKNKSNDTWNKRHLKQTALETKDNQLTDTQSKRHTKPKEKTAKVEWHLKIIWNDKTFPRFRNSNQIWISSKKKGRKNAQNYLRFRWKQQWIPALYRQRRIRIKTKKPPKKNRKSVGIPARLCLEKEMLTKNLCTDLKQYMYHRKNFFFTQNIQ